MIAGSARGRQLKGPPGHQRGRASDVRPSSDLVRGALFDALAALGADFSRTLDLYAGPSELVQAFPKTISHPPLKIIFWHFRETSCRDKTSKNTNTVPDP